MSSALVMRGKARGGGGWGVTLKWPISPLPYCKMLTGRNMAFHPEVETGLGTSGSILFFS